MRKWLVALGLSLATALGAAQSNAEFRHDLRRRLSGRYIGSGTALEWYTPQSSAVLLNISNVFVFNYDGTGEVTGSITDVIADANGAFPNSVCLYDVAGTYDLDADGTGTESINLEGIPNGTTPGPFGCVTQATEEYSLTWIRSGRKVCGAITLFSFPGFNVSSIVGSFCASKD
jgi:hypothetical protein